MKKPPSGTRQPHAAPNSSNAAVRRALEQAALWYDRGGFAESAEFCRAVLRIQPDHVAALNLLGIMAARSGQTAQAEAFFERVLIVDPADAHAHNNYGNVLKNSGRPGDSLASYRCALRLNPRYAEAHNNLGNALSELARFDEALASYDRALETDPTYVEAYFNRGMTLQQLDRLEEAIASLDRVIALRSDHADAMNSRGNVLRSLGRLDAAIASYDRAFDLRPDFVAPLTNRGLCLQDLGRPDEALECHERALRLEPDHAEALNNRGTALHELRRFAPALDSYERAIHHDGNYADPRNNRGNVLFDLGRFDEAVESYRQAVAINPDYVEAHGNLANVLRRIGRLEEAVERCDRVLAMRPEHAWTFGLRSFAKASSCDWRNFAQEATDLEKRIVEGRRACAPLPVLALSHSAGVQRFAAETWVRARCPGNPCLGDIPLHSPAPRIRIGYFSPDFREHAVSRLTAQLFEMHDRTRFEIIAFSFGLRVRDAMRRRLEGAFDRFIEVRESSDAEIARLARDSRIDIAVDLAGFTEESRTEIFALRAAPVQVSYLGYLGTMGAPYIDYLIADRVLVPADEEHLYAEKILLLPSYQANDSTRAMADRIFSREELGLPPVGFVFCCFNQSYKLRPATFDGWMRILTRTPGSVLLLHADNEAVRRNLKAEARLRGVDDQRLIFAAPLSYPEYLARFRSADLFLDTQPYNAGATASDALWAGLPVLTCRGGTFAGRMAASLLTALGMRALIASDQARYEDLAVDLATDPRRHAAVKQQLAEQRATAVLFDTRSFTRHLEAAYHAIHARRCAALPAERIEIPP